MATGSPNQTHALNKCKHIMYMPALICIIKINDCAHYPWHHRYEIMSTCWQESPSLRPSFADLRGMLDSLLDKGEYTSLM